VVQSGDDHARTSRQAARAVSPRVVGRRLRKARGLDPRSCATLGGGRYDWDNDHDGDRGYVPTSSMISSSHGEFGNSEELQDEFVAPLPQMAGRGGGCGTRGAVACTKDHRGAAVRGGGRCTAEPRRSRGNAPWAARAAGRDVGRGLGFGGARQHLPEPGPARGPRRVPDPSAVGSTAPSVAVSFSRASLVDRPAIRRGRRGVSIVWGEGRIGRDGR